MKPEERPSTSADQDRVLNDLAGLIGGLAAAAPTDQPPAAARVRLMQRVHEAVAAAQAFSTVHLRQQRAAPVAPGVVARELYASEAATLRDGEPRRVMLIELAAGSAWSFAPAGAGGLRREWLLIEGDSLVDESPLRPGSYLVTSGCAPIALRSIGGGWAYLRETPVPATTTTTAYTQHDAGALWLDYAPGVQRRLLWQQGQEAAMLFRAQAGARVPAHGHGHDEECLMLEGEVFLDDILLRRGEYQIAPAGTRHGGVFTDTGALLYAHGDLDLALL